MDAEGTSWVDWWARKRRRLLPFCEGWANIFRRLRKMYPRTSILSGYVPKGRKSDGSNKKKHTSTNDQQPLDPKLFQHRDLQM
jgi:ketopantoate reductase